MVEPSVAPAQPDPAWIVGKHALMNVRATSRRGRTEIDPLRWRIPFQWQGCHYQDHDDQPFMMLVNSGGGFVEGDVAHFHAVLEPGTRALFTTTASSKFYKCPGGGVSREIVDFQVGEDALLEFCPDEAIPLRPEQGAPDQPDRYDAPRPGSSPPTWSRPAVCTTARARSFASTIWSRSSASPSAASLVALDRLIATRARDHRRAGAAVAGASGTWRQAFAYAPDLRARMSRTAFTKPSPVSTAPRRA